MYMLVLDIVYMFGVLNLKNLMQQPPTSQALTHLQADKVMRHMLIVLGWLRRLIEIMFLIQKYLPIGQVLV